MRPVRLSLPFLAAGVALAAMTAVGALAGPPSPTGPAPAAPSVRRVTSAAEREALRSISKAAEERIAVLAARLSGMPEGPGRLALQREVQAIKTDAQVRRLRTIAGFARGRGDLALAVEAESAVRDLLEPGWRRAAYPSAKKEVRP